MNLIADLLRSKYHSADYEGKPDPDLPEITICPKAVRKLMKGSAPLSVRLRITEEFRPGYHKITFILEDEDSAMFWTRGHVKASEINWNHVMGGETCGDLYAETQDWLQPALFGDEPHREVAHVYVSFRETKG